MVWFRVFQARAALPAHFAVPCLAAPAGSPRPPHMCGASSVSQADSMARTSRISYLQRRGRAYSVKGHVPQERALPGRWAWRVPPPRGHAAPRSPHAPRRSRQLTSRCRSAPRRRSRPTGGGSGRARSCGGCGAWPPPPRCRRSAPAGTQRPPCRPRLQVGEVGSGWKSRCRAQAAAAVRRTRSGMRHPQQLRRPGASTPLGSPAPCKAEQGAPDSLTCSSSVSLAAFMNSPAASALRTAGGRGG